MAIESIRLSEKERLQLITLKKRTKIENWNTLCRWALCISLAEKSPPPHEELSSDSNIEMTWKTFTGGGNEEIYLALLKMRASQDEVVISNNELAYVRLHINRGISYLISTTTNIVDIFDNCSKDD
ncbi:DNA sulfur modification protein DndE [Candidatus Peregrinibacteria bacterium]|jgi:DNA sulfur modification protein DndE|nr:DNA sulfur modification protein DndE [Candidatus Scalindua sp.]MBT7930070.1 DNA sulfur modification protein DndE [Candidatus Peregrinibacteria bacterium]